MSRYRLVEISYEEHVALYEAGAWTQWDFRSSNGSRWYKVLNNMLLDRPSLAPNDDFNNHYDQKYYTRVEDNDEH